ncbi:MAG TPA: PIN domain-containing protein [Burkholderiales bacterium]|nr:PIN domain-containing protein [Burkholderiales bacterium]
MNLLLDSVILIDHFNGVEAATTYLAANYGDAAISVITRAEVLAGFAEADLKKAIQLLDTFVTLQIDEPIADLAASLRRKHGWKLPDAFQAALAQHHSLKLVTRNEKDFNRRHAWVLVPYRV